VIKAPILKYSPDFAQDVGVGPLRVLVADENPGAVIALMNLLRQEGYEVRGVYEGNDVWQTAKDFTPDAVVLDAHMPGMSGDDMARALQERYGEKEIMLIEIEHQRSQPLDMQAISDVLSRLKPAST
jgi:DNA-binding response OmpR family regulator